MSGIGVETQVSAPRFEPRFLHVAFIALVTLTFYAGTIDNYWIKDDLGVGAFTDGEHLDWGHLPSFWWPSHMTSEQYWRPIPITLGFVDYAFWGTNPCGYHVVNTLLHALVGVLVYLLANRLAGFANPTLGFVAGLAVVLNPIAPEAVVWVLQRMVLICAIFSLSAMLAWLKAIETGQTRWRVVGYLCLVGGLLSKEVIGTLPGVLFLMDLLYARADRSLRQRLLTAIRWAIPAALLLAAYIGCRYALWGRIDLKYAGLEPMEYARHNRVFELMGSSLASSVLPVNAGIFSESAREALRGAMLAAYALAALRGVWLLAVAPRFRRLVPLMAAFLVLSFAPTMLAFWIDERLFNGRFFYQPGIAVLLTVAVALWHSPRDAERGLDPPSWAGRIVPYVGSALLLGAFAISLAGGLRAFEQGSQQVRDVQKAIVRYATDLRDHGVEPVIVALDTPSQVRGVPTFETNLRLALQPPLVARAVPCIPLL
ncbi:MAG: hypothetical protein KDB18_13130, partial [Salinibacterium sp.]|nr:hypothetical protein [Salinibacterium sp.]